MTHQASSKSQKGSSQSTTKSFLRQVSNNPTSKPKPDTPDLIAFQSTEGAKKVIPFTKFDHAQARLKWARATRDCKIEKIREVRSEIDALKKAMDVKAMEIKMLKEERASANERVQIERNAYREELVEVTCDVENQLDPRILDGYSSDIAFMRSSPFTEVSSNGAGVDDVDDELGNRDGAKTPTSVQAD